MDFSKSFHIQGTLECLTPPLIFAAHLHEFDQFLIIQKGSVRVEHGRKKMPNESIFDAKKKKKSNFEMTPYLNNSMNLILNFGGIW